jgi:act minimal PKS chain-length factor (CLF/KS beta)
VNDVVISGIGVVTANGSNLDAYWENTLAGRNAIAPISRFDPGAYPVRLAAEVTDFESNELIASRLVVQTDVWTQFALHATDRALADAGIDLAGLDEYDMGVVTASSSGGNEFGQREISRLWTQGPAKVSTYQSIAWFYAATTGQISIKHGMRGPCGVLVGEQAGGLDAIGQTRRTLRSGARLVVTGGTEASLSPYALVCQLSSGLVSRSDRPDRAYLPFDSDASGYVPGEGGAILVAESGPDARARDSSHPYGRIAGYAATFDPAPGRRGEPGLGRAARAAIADAALHPDDIDVVFADAAGVPELDRAEARAIAELFAPRVVPVAAPKSLTGRLYAGGGPLDVVSALLSIRDGIVPPANAAIRVDPEHAIDLVTARPRPMTVQAALVLARGFGGFNSAVVVTAP